MREITVHRDINAPKSAVWATLADFPNIADWNSGVNESHSTSEASDGVGAQRHCELAPLGSVDETVREWNPEDRLVISIDSTRRMPIANGLVTFTLGDGEGVTPTSLHYSYNTKYGVLGKMMGPMLDKKMLKGFDGFLFDLEKAAVGVPG